MKRAIIDKIRVLQFIHSSGVTGPGRIVYGLADNLDHDEFICDIACPDIGPLADDLRSLGKRIIPFEPGELHKAKSVIKLAGIIKKGGYHVLHIHSGQCSAFWKALARLAGIPAVIYTEHVEGQDHSWIKGDFARALHMLAHPASNMMVDKVIAVSDQTRSVFIERQGMPREKTVVIHNGVYTRLLKNDGADRVALREKFGIPAGAIIIGTVARLVSDKGHKFLVLAAKEIVKERHDVRFIIVGDGPARGEIEELIEYNGLKEYFIMAGFRPDAYSIMDFMDIVVQPSRRASESFGLTVVEAMAKSKPVVASDIGCFREIIEDGVSGLLFVSEDPESLKEKLLALLKDKELRASIGAAAEKKAEASFDISITAKKTGQLYIEVLASKGFIFDKNAMCGINSFLDMMAMGEDASGQNTERIRKSLFRYIDLIKDRKLSQLEVDSYLDKEDNFIIESFLSYLEKAKARCEGAAAHNNDLFRKAIMRKPVTARDYDERIEAQSLEFQIDNYYEPKDNSLRRRIDVVLGFLMPGPGEVILDVGCGVGTFAYRCAEAGAKAYGMDYSRGSIKAANELAGRFGYASKLEYTCCDVCSRIPYPDNFFDKIVAADFIEHIDGAQKESLLSEMLRVLKEPGEIVIFTPNALREKLGAAKASLIKLFGGPSVRTRLHYGLTDRFTFEKMLKARGLKFERNFIDIGRPYLAGIPVLKGLLSLDILWVIKR